jgi:hypothetical protein
MTERPNSPVKVNLINMSKIGTKNTVKYVKRPSSAGAKDVRPASIGHSGKIKNSSSSRSKQGR